MNFLRRLIGSITPIEKKVVNIPVEIIEIVTPIEKEIVYESSVLNNLKDCKDVLEQHLDSLNNDPFAICLFTDFSTRFKHIDDVFNIFDFLQQCLEEQIKSPNKNVDLMDFINDFHYRKPIRISLGRFISDSTVNLEDVIGLQNTCKYILKHVETMGTLYVPFIEQPTLIESSLSYFDRVINPFTEELLSLLNVIIKADKSWQRKNKVVDPEV